MPHTSKKHIIENLQKIRNIGPKMAEKLFQAGIYDYQSMLRLGTENVYMMVDESGGFCNTHHAAYLYALEAAIIDCAWQRVPEARKNKLKNFAKKLRNTNNPKQIF